MLREEKAILNLRVAYLRGECTKTTDATNAFQHTQLRQRARLRFTEDRVVSLEEKVFTVEAQNQKVQEYLESL